MNRCETCGEKGDPRVVGPRSRMRVQCGECGREGGHSSRFAGAVELWNRSNPTEEPDVEGVFHRRKRSRDNANQKRRRSAARGDTPKEKPGKAWREGFAVAKPEHVADYYRGRPA